MVDDENQSEDEERSLVHRSADQLRRLVHHVLHEGVGPITGSASYADERLRRWHDPEQAIRRIRAESTLAAGTAGFVTGLGGLITLPLALPANLAGSLIINVRMVGAIAHLRQWDLGDPHTETIATLVAAGSSAQAATSRLGVKLGTEGAKQALRAVPISVLREINKKAGFMLLAKYGTKRSAVTLAKAIPLAGGVVGGGVDATLTAAAGRAASAAFPL